MVYVFESGIFSLPSHDYSEQLEKPNPSKQSKQLKNDYLEQSEQLDEYYQYHSP